MISKFDVNVTESLFFPNLFSAPRSAFSTMIVALRSFNAEYPAHISNIAKIV